MTDEDASLKITALDRVVANASNVHLTLMVGSERVWLDMDHKTASDIVQTIADALTQLKHPDVTTAAGVALYEASKFEAHLEKIPGMLGLQEKFVVTAHGQGSTKITLRLAPEKADEFLAQAEQHSARKRKATKN